MQLQRTGKGLNLKYHKIRNTKGGFINYAVFKNVINQQNRSKFRKFYLIYFKIYFDLIMKNDIQHMYAFVFSAGKALPRALCNLELFYGQEENYPRRIIKGTKLTAFTYTKKKVEIIIMTSEITEEDSVHIFTRFRF